MEELNNLKHEEFGIQQSRDDGRINLRWSGSLFVPEPETILEPYLDGILEEARGDGLRIRFQFEDMETMNSVVLSFMIRYLRKIEENRVPVYFTYDPAKKLQIAFFKSLSYIAQKSEYITVSEKNV